MCEIFFIVVVFWKPFWAVCMPEWATQPALCTTIFKVFFECARTLEYYVAGWLKSQSLKCPCSTPPCLHVCSIVVKKVSTKLLMYIQWTNFRKRSTINVFFIFLTECTMYNFHDSTDTLKFWTEKWSTNKTFLFFIWFLWNLVKL